MSDEIIQFSLRRSEIEFACTMMSEAPYRLAAPIIAAIGEQIKTHDANKDEKKDI